MADLRSGGFGSGGLNPFGGGGGGDSRYLINSPDSTGADVAYLAKLKAQTAWGNGKISDEQYVAALKKYVSSTDADSSRRVSAENELLDTTRSISRNKRVRSVNQAAEGTDAKTNALLKLLQHERKDLRGMDRGNEQYREQRDRVSSLEGDVRLSRWTKVADQYKRDQVSDQAMRALATRLANEAGGAPDAQGWRDQAHGYRNKIVGEQLNDATNEWGADPTGGNAKRVDSLYGKLMEGMSKDSPEFKDLTERRTAFGESVVKQQNAMRDAKVESNYQNGRMTDDQYISHKHMRMNEADRGTEDYIRKRDAFLSASYIRAEKNIRSAIAEGTMDGQDFIDLKAAQLALTDPGSARALEIEAQIASVRGGAEFGAAGTLSQPDTGRGEFDGGRQYGHYVYPNGAPGGRGPSADGFVSQFDGSHFANTNCGMAAAAMLAWSVSGGKTKVNGGQMRYYSGDTEDDGKGTNVRDGGTALGSLGIKSKAFSGDLSYTGFKQRIKQGKPAVLSGISGYLAPELQIGGYKGAHGVYVDRVQTKNGKDWFFVLDPLGRKGYDGQWWDEESLKRYGWNSEISGFALFAGKGGHQKSKTPGKAPPAQAFDTDFDGRSTLGAGGGTSREEAGARADWTNGIPTPESERTGADAEMVTDFLAAISTIESRVRSNAKGDGAFEVSLSEDSGARARAQAVLERNGGDPRLAGIEWYTGETPDRDSTTWTASDRFYANGIGKQLEWPKVRKGVTLDEPEAPERPEGTDAGAVDVVPGGGTPPTLDEGAPREVAPLEGVNADLERASRDLLNALGLSVSTERIRAMASWIMAENDDAKVTGHNPLNLQTASDTQLSGQIGRSDDGRANFGTYEEGIAATAAVIRQDIPSVIGALRSGDPMNLGRVLEGADWSAGNTQYGNDLVRAYNTLPGTETIIGNVGSTTPAYGELAGAARDNPDLEDLLDVDPNDPRQMAWYDEQAQRFIDGARAGVAVVEYETPDGERHFIQMDPGMGRDVAMLSVRYATQGDLGAPDALGRLDKANRDMASVTHGMAWDTGMDALEALKVVRDTNMRRYHDPQGLALAVNAENEMARIVNALSGQPPNATPDASAITNPFVIADAAKMEAVTGLIEGLEPYQGDATIPDTYAPGGTKLGAAVFEGYIVPEYERNVYTSNAGVLGAGTSGHASAAVLSTDPEKESFVEVMPDGTSKLWTAKTNPAAFKSVPDTVGTDPENMQQVDTPNYRSSKGDYMPITFSDGHTAHVKITYEMMEVPIFEREPTGKAVVNTTKAQSGQAEGVAYVESGEARAFAKSLAFPLDGFAADIAQTAGTATGVAAAAKVAGKLAPRLIGAAAASVLGPAVGAAAVTLPILMEGANQIGNAQTSVSRGGSAGSGQKAIAPVDLYDGLVTYKGNMRMRVQTATAQDPTSHKPMTLYSFDGVKWAITYKTIAEIPGIMIHDVGTKTKAGPDGTLVAERGGEAYDFSTQGLEGVAHIYGDEAYGEEDRLAGDANGTGGPGKDMILRDSFAFSEGQVFTGHAGVQRLGLDASSLSPEEAVRNDFISPRQAINLATVRAAEAAYKSSFSPAGRGRTVMAVPSSMLTGGAQSVAPFGPGPQSFTDVAIGTRVQAQTSVQDKSTAQTQAATRVARDEVQAQEQPAPVVRTTPLKPQRDPVKPPKATTPAPKAKVVGGSTPPTGRSTEPLTETTDPSRTGSNRFL